MKFVITSICIILILCIISLPAAATDRYITITEFQKWQQSKKDVLLVDVRESDAYRQEHLPGAINIPAEEHRKIRAHAPKIAVLYCWEEGTASEVADDLNVLGYTNVVVLRGGIEGWKRQKLKTVRL